MIIRGKELKIGDDIFVYNRGGNCYKKTPRYKKNGGAYLTITGFTPFMILFDDYGTIGRVDNRSVEKTWQFSENC